MSKSISFVFGQIPQRTKHRIDLILNVALPNKVVYTCIPKETKYFNGNRINWCLEVILDRVSKHLLDSDSFRSKRG